mgnify:FL=1|tara:strand:+ start:75 stop:845 length:771 start_codon:yes stop_codon:yes gene_type:complete
MNRHGVVDLFKGVAVMLMIIYHFYYFPHQYGFTEIKYNTPFLKTIARIAQIIFITAVGINLHLSKRKMKDKKDFIDKSLKRIAKIFFFAILMSLFTYAVFGDNFVKFGILHFVALSSLLLFMIADDKHIISIITLILVMLIFALKNNPDILENSFPKPIGFILGFNKGYSSIDHFPLIPWLLLVCVGILLGSLIHEYKPRFYKETDTTEIIEIIGKYSLEIYAVHWLVLYYIYCRVYPEYIRPLPKFESKVSEFNK